jgi:putative intracellular protease/amidase
MRLSIILFDGFTTLDVVGGYEVLARLPGMEVEFVAAKRGVVAADTRRLGLAAYRTFDEVPDTDILYVPGGPGARLLEQDRSFHDYLRTLDASSQWTVGICNGCTLLAAAGILAGKATTNWFDRDKLRQYNIEFVAERYHREGKYITGAGVSASIDTGLFLANILAGPTAAKAIQLGIEYFPMPPFAERAPAESRA